MATAIQRRGKQAKGPKAQGLYEEIRTESLTGPQKGAEGVQRLQCGREEEKKGRRNESVEMQDLSSTLFASNLECAGDNLSEHRLYRHS